MSTFKETFGEGTYLYCDDCKWFAVDGELAKEHVLQLLQREMVEGPVSVDHVQEDYARFGFASGNEGAPSWHTNNYGPGKGARKVWTVEIHGMRVAQPHERYFNRVQAE